MRAVVFVLLFSLAACVTNAQTRATIEMLTPLIKTFAFQDNPKLNPTTRFKIEEYHIEGLWEALKIQLFLTRYISPDGQQFNERLLIYHDGKLTPFSRTFGGYGLMSGLVDGPSFYYTYSWGSGIHRSQIGRIWINEGRIRIIESGEYEGINLFIRKVGEKILVETGIFFGFNSWESGQRFGWVESKASSLVVFNEEGEEIVPRSGPMK